MYLQLKRVEVNPQRTHGQLFIDGVYFCDVLEDTDRGLSSSDALQSILERKLYGRTAIPYGKYTIVTSYSPRFNKQLPLLLNVPGYAGIRIHPGNTEKDTLGCLLVGRRSGDKVLYSRGTFDKLFSRISKAMKGETITIEITHGY